MDIKKKSLIVTIILWILVISLMITPIAKCIDSYINGTNIALEGTKIAYGMEAVEFTLSLYIAFYFPFFVMWVILFILSIILTVVTVKRYKDK